MERKHVHPITMSNPIPSHYWDVQALSTFLSIKPYTLYAWAAQGRIPCVKLHGLVRFQHDDIERWVESFRVHESPVTPNAAPRGTPIIPGHGETRPKQSLSERRR